MVGAGLAGLRAAETLRREGFPGELLLLGDEDRPPYDRPPLSKEYLAGRLAPERLGLRTAEKLAELRLTLQLGQPVVALDPKEGSLALADGRELRADGVVAASGAFPRTFALSADLQGLFVLRRPEEADALAESLFPPDGFPPDGAAVPGDAAPRRLVVLGAGFIGCEVAATLRARGGVSVTLVDPLPRPLGRALPAGFGELLAAVHHHQGVVFVLGRTPRGLRTSTGRQLPLGRPDQLVPPAALQPGPGSERVTGVLLDDGQELPADAVLVAVGVAPATSWLTGSGLELHDGLVVDPSLRAAPGVVGCGDLVRWPHPLRDGLVRLEHWTNASEQGTAAARALLADAAGDPPPVFQTVPYVWSDQYDLKIQVLGWPEPEDELVPLQGSLDPEIFGDQRQLLAVAVREGRVQGAIGIGLPRPLMLLRPLVQRSAPLAEVRELLNAPAAPPRAAPGPRPG